MAETNNNYVSGVLEILDNGPAYVRDPRRNYAVSGQNPQVPRNIIQKFRLRGGEPLSGMIGRGQNNRGQTMLATIESISDFTPDAYSGLKQFDQLPVIHPQEALKFELPGGPISTRIVDLFAPIGKGQRGLIVSPPRSGKTVLLAQMAQGLMKNHPEVLLMVLLVDERPEEVTETRRAVCPDSSGWDRGAPEVVYSSNDSDAKSHGRIAKLMIEKAKRYVEMGKDVVILLDSLTRLGRAFNALVGSSGRTMTGGLDIRALEVPKQIFGSARKIENGGSLTIIASVLIETGSRMDDYIFQEFKGTGNMELILSRELSNLRIWPAMDLAASGTRKEEILLGQANYDKISRVRRRLMSMPPAKQMESMIAEMSKFKTNQEFLDNLAS